MTKEEILHKHKEVKKDSTNRARMTIIGFSLIAGAILFSLFNAFKLEQKNQALREENKEHMRILAIQDSTIKHNDKVIESKAKILNSLMYEVNRLSDTAITVNGTYELLNNYYDEDGRQMYEFKIWLSSSFHHLQKIREVHYKAFKTSMKVNSRSSSRVTNGFLVDFNYFDCFEALKIIILYDDNTDQTLYFDICTLFPDKKFLKYNEEIISARVDKAQSVFKVK